MVKNYKMFINGEWAGARSGQTFDVISPANGKVLAKVPAGDREDVDAGVDAARTSFEKGVWSQKTPAERSAIMWRFARLVEKNAEQLARLESQNQGKSIKYARDSDLPLVVDNIQFFASAARMLEGKAAAEYSGLGTSFVRREPLGVVAGIVPWNYPLLIAVWKVAPALAAGNSVVLKPASYTPLTALELARLAHKAGIPKGVFNVVTGSGSNVGAPLASHKKISMISFTGDTSTGKKIMEMASKNVTRVHLELGGKAPMIVLPDADIFTAADGAVTGGFWNTGQDCTAVTRVIAHESIYDSLVKKMVQLAKTKFRLGDPSKETTDLGPLVSFKHFERVDNHVRTAKEQGAKILCGGGRPKGKQYEKGAFFEPTIITNVKQEQKICQEEVFGPVITVQPYKNVDEAIRMGNGVKQGLASSVWGKNITDCMKVAARLEFGTVWINDHGILTSEMPHGGFKMSGFGKDLSLYSLDEYTRVKHVYVDLTGNGEKDWHSTVHK